MGGAGWGWRQVRQAQGQASKLLSLKAQSVGGSARNTSRPPLLGSKLACSRSQRRQRRTTTVDVRAAAGSAGPWRAEAGRASSGVIQKLRLTSAGSACTRMPWEPPRTQTRTQTTAVGGAFARAVEQKQSTGLSHTKRELWDTSDNASGANATCMSSHDVLKCWLGHTCDPSESYLYAQSCVNGCPPRMRGKLSRSSDAN